MPEKQLSKQDQKHIEKHVDKKLSEQLPTKAELLGAQFKQHVSTAIIAAFSFLIALSWKDVIVHAVEALIKEEFIGSIPYLSDLIAAIAITLIAILGILLVTSWARKPHVIQSETATS
ncbi:MAG: DUF5654 family protein [Nanoarchaeota archaeon]